MKIKVHGKEREFTERELTSILEEDYERKYYKKDITPLMTATPTEGNWYLVDPEKIDQSLFEEERDDFEQEKARKEIQKAFSEMRNNPVKYNNPFKTMIPFRIWDKHTSKTFVYLHEIAKIIGDDEADMVEQSLEWAQRIQNEGWEAVCNMPDKARSYRAVRTRYPGLYKIYGASSDADKMKAAATHIMCNQYLSEETAGCTVPLVVSRKFISST